VKASHALIFVAVVLGVVYAGLSIALSPGAFFSGDEGVRWLQVDSIVRHRWTSLAVDPPGGDLDPYGEFVPAFVVPVGDEFRSVFPATLPLLSSVPYALLGTRGIYLLPALCAILCMAAVTRLALPFVRGAGRNPRGWAALAGIATVAATPLVFYGATFWEHTPAILLVTCAMIPIVSAVARDTGSAPTMPLFAAGVALGVAATARTEAALMVPAVIVAGAAARGWRFFARPAAAVAAGAAFILLPQSVYHYSVYGSFIPPHLEANLAGGALGRSTVSPAYNLVEMLAPVRWRPAVAALLAAAAVTALWPRARRLVRARRSGAAVLTAGLASSVFLLAAGPLHTLLLRLGGPALSTHDRGFQSLPHTMPLVCLLPLLALAPPLSGPGGGRAPARFLWWTLSAFVALVVALAPVPGGLQWGPRLLLPAVPLLTIGIVAAIAERPAASFRRPAMAALAVTLAAGVAVQVVGLRFLVAVRAHNGAIVESVRRTVPHGDVVVSDFFPVPQLLSTLSASTPALYARGSGDLEALAERVEAEGKSMFRIERARGAPRGETVELGGGLRLVHDGPDTGVRGFLRTPKGD